MDRKAFKQRMQNLKSYRENNPGKGYWDWKLQSFADGGEVPPKRRGGYDRQGNIVVPVTSENGIQNVTTPQVTITPKDNIDLSASIDRGRKAFGDIGREVLSNTTPFGDIESAVYAYDAIKNRDWLGMSLAAATMLPFVPGSINRSRKISKLPKRNIPTVNKNLTQEKNK